MRIQESDIRLSSRHEQEYRQEVEIHGERSFRSLFQGLAGAGQATKAEQGGDEREEVVRMLQSLVDAILAALEGKKCRTALADEGQFAASAGPSPRTVEMEWSWETTERISEHERTQVEAGGVIKTADGRTIDFGVNLDLCRDYSCERSSTESGKVVLHDPLVLNFAGKSAELTGDRFSFDLDSDGKVESLPGLDSGSCFLVLDRNGNGKADDGRELFGATTGNGFKELAGLDGDGNGWIDEGDSVFSRLRLWDGNKMTSLAEKGVGALWLRAADSPFALKDQANQLLGEIRATGLYLSESGQAGTMQQVDLAIPVEESSGIPQPGGSPNAGRIAVDRG